MNRKVLVLSIGAVLVSAKVYADNTAIMSANNQIFADGEFAYDRLSYSSNAQASDAGAPLFNAHLSSPGAMFGLTKTFGRVYTQFALGASQAAVSYNDSSADANPVSNGTSTTLSLLARLGYSFYLHNNFAVTPYLFGAYANNQLDTGGFSTDFFPAYYNGATFSTQSFYYGIGLFNQWAVMPRWVLGLDAQIGTQYHPNVSANVNNFNNQPMANTTWQQWNLSSAQVWKVGLNSDYRVTPNVHLRAGVAYGHNDLGSANSAATGVFPSQKNQYWQENIGLGYSFADVKAGDVSMGSGNQAAIHAVNNLGSLHVGYLTQNFSGGTSFNRYSQTNAAPSLGLVFSKTLQNFYMQLNARDAFSASSNQAQNTYFDVSGKLGYQFASSYNTALTPYATLGYHRGFQSGQGAPTNSGFLNNLFDTYYINGITETYQHNWYGLGVLAQWAATQKLVFSADANFGRTFNTRMQSWIPLFLPMNTSYQLGDANYQMVSAGADYLLAKNLHGQLNVSYWHYAYNPSNVNALGFATLTDISSQVGVDLGLGYSFG